MDLSTLQSLLGAVAGVRVACIGDLMLDRYVYGEVARISPEAPIPVLARKRETTMLGGAGNVARNVAALGGCAPLTGLVGDDHVLGEIGQVLAGGLPGRRSPDEVTLYKSLGSVVQDLAAGWWLFRQASEQGFGQAVSL